MKLSKVSQPRFKETSSSPVTAPISHKKVVLRPRWQLAAPIGDLAEINRVQVSK